MKIKNIILIIVSLFFFNACVSVQTPTTKQQQNINKKLTARLTAYTAFEDKWGSRVAMCPKMRAKQGVTVAAHPNFNFGTKISVPELKGVLDNDCEFIVQDRGSAVTKKKASRGKYYVFDIYLQAANKRDSRKKLIEFGSKFNLTEIKILN